MPRANPMHKKHGSVLDKTCKDCEFLKNVNHCGNVITFYNCGLYARDSYKAFEPFWMACGLFKQKIVLDKKKKEL
jgi:hypothetical protein